MTSSVLDGPAIVWCDGAFNTPEGKTAHGLVRFTQRYQTISIIDTAHAGQDAGMVLDRKDAGIPVVSTLAEALAHANSVGVTPTHFVIGMAPDGGRLPDNGRACVMLAIDAGLNVDCGLHDFLTEDPVIAPRAAAAGVTLRDVRKPPDRKDLHHFSSRIDEVKSLKVAILGTDSAIGKRTTAWILVHALQQQGCSTEMIGTGQTGWLQGARYSMVLDSLVNDFVAGELEHAVVSAWDERAPKVIVIEGQGSLMNPAYPGGLEILAATRPEAIVLQHAPTRLEYDGFPGFPLQDILTQIHALELVGGRPVVAIALNHEGLGSRDAIDIACAELAELTGLPVCDPLVHGVDILIQALSPWLPTKAKPKCALFV
jgi:uncharacterized NAD-dependent epimerase/dehydratase family protein